MKKRATVGQQKGANATKAKAAAFALFMRDPLNEHLERGDSFNQIAREWNAEGVPTQNGGKWTAKSIALLAERVEQLPPVPVSPEQIEAEKQKREQQRVKGAKIIEGLNSLDRWALYPGHWDKDAGKFVVPNEAFDTSPLTADEAADLEYLKAEVKRQAERDAEAARFVGPIKPNDLALARLKFEHERKAELSAIGRMAAEAKKQKKKLRAKE